MKINAVSGVLVALVAKRKGGRGVVLAVTDIELDGIDSAPPVLGSILGGVGAGSFSAIAASSIMSSLACSNSQAAIFSFIADAMNVTSIRRP